ncbi:ferredoxin [Halarchaeum acidiphilum MH1-52-1]|uniref:Ferredoxin n=1 Tax=Halarchaeum acidiphilum MH1-52-1 TaxID=1261545 RepID=U2YG26_9EURY|nr:ferredoxin [Halarchaeum acidiphilum]GAD53151.1 ferredoxin [Halarchaeum acidiphilum MH1-52-1]
MRVEFDRDACIGMYQCVTEWEAGFEADRDAGKAILTDGEETADGVFVRDVPADAELDAKFAARACPVDAIRVYDDDGEQVV